jgi:hypothetical protein
MMVEELGLERQAGSALLHTNVIQAQTLAVTLAGYLTSSWHYQEATSQKRYNLLRDSPPLKLAHPGSCMRPRIEKVAEIRNRMLGGEAARGQRATKNRAES